MPMFVEVCANCGCNEFAHHWDEETDSPYWECGRCSEATWIEEPDAMLCICGCTEEAHYPGRRCQECDDCDRFEEHETVVAREVGRHPHLLDGPTTQEPP